MSTDAQPAAPRDQVQQLDPGPLRPYQLEGVRFLLESSSALLADEMGLGKTVQAVTAIRSGKAAYRRVLIIAPASLCLNWEREIERWAPDLVVRRVIGTATDRSYTYRLPIQILIASFEQIRMDCQDLATHVRFDLVIIDEAQRLKNNSSALNLACRIIPRERSWALTGTPLENEQNDLVAVFGFIKPQLVRNSMSRSQIHEEMKPHFLRRTKRDVLGELPPILSRELRLELGHQQRQAYDEVWNSRDAVREITPTEAGSSLLALLTRLKQICNFDEQSGESVKLDALQDVLDRIEAMNEKILIFSQYVDSLMKISSEITITHDIYHGGLTMTQRDKILTAFRELPGPRALLISLQAGGVGLNLQEASTVILFDRWWNPAKEDQAIHRAHRYGRESPLEVISFLVEDSVEERIDSVLEAKRALFREYITKAPQDDRWAAQTLRRILDL